MTQTTNQIRTHRGLTTKRTEVEDIKTLGHRFAEHSVSLEDLIVTQGNGYDTSKSPGSKSNLRETKIVLPNGKELSTSMRFWTSLAAKAGFSHNIFNLFDYVEVFERIRDRGKISSAIRLTEHVNEEQCLSISELTKSIVKYDDLLDLIDNYGGTKIRYGNGKVQAFHSLQHTALFKIAEEEYMPQLQIEAPVDGYGHINIYLSLMRLKCENGLVGMAKAFKSQVKVGKNDGSVLDALERMFDSYSNDEGLNAIAERLESAKTSIMSVQEALSINKGIVEALHYDNTERTKESIEASNRIRSEWQGLIGDLNKEYGIANLEQATEKHRKSLPTKCLIYDAINFVTELNTHVLTRGREEDTEHVRKLNGTIGNIITNQYDLENIIPEQMKSRFTNYNPPDYYFTSN